jgi:hypothetical protein
MRGMAVSMRNTPEYFSGRGPARKILALIVGVVFATPVGAQNPSSLPVQPPFPDTEALVSRVPEHQRDVETLFNQYTCTIGARFTRSTKLGRCEVSIPILVT